MREQPYLLIVEDDLDLSEMLSAYFRAQGYDCSTVAWGDEAVRLAADDPPDLILLDVGLPDINGYEVCRRLSVNRRTQTIPVICLTDLRDRTDKLNGLELGVVDYVTKPFDIHELRLRVRNTLRRAGQTARTNPVTGLREGEAVGEMLVEAAQSARSWAVLRVSLAGMDHFREQYGFLAADDVLRAVGMILNNALRDLCSEDQAAGHLTAHEFVALIDAADLPALRERVEQRLTSTIALFYPFHPAPDTGDSPPAQRLRVSLSQITSADGPFADLDAIKAALATPTSASS